MAETYTGPGRDPVPETTYLSAMIKRTAWGAIIAGAITAISVQILFTVLGVALGVTVQDASSTALGAMEFTTAGAIWWLITGTIALLIGGAVVGRLTGMLRSTDVLLHAFSMWAVTAIFGATVVGTSAGVARMHTNDTVAIQDDRNLPSDRRIDDSRIVAGETATREEAMDAAQVASWWTLGGLLLGIAASLAGAWMFAPERIVVRHTNAGVPVGGIGTRP